MASLFIKFKDDVPGETIEEIIAVHGARQLNPTSEAPDVLRWYIAKFPDEHYDAAMQYYRSFVGDAIEMIEELAPRHPLK